ncbi:MAG: ATP-binding protein [Acidobacteriota bacterium]|nr:ATP-binding protein [Acidobacteriota bacterium]
MKLYVTSPPHEACEIDMTGRSVIIGRASGCDLILKQPGVSRRHARLFFTKGQWMVEDLGSTHGTYLLGKPIYNAVVISPGDVLTLAPDKTAYSLVIHDEHTGPAPSMFELPELSSDTVFHDAATLLKTSLLEPGEGASQDVVRDYARRLNYLMQANEALSKVRGIDQLFECFLEHLSAIFRPDMTVLYMEENGRFVPAAHKPDLQPPPISQTLECEISQSKNAVLARDVTLDGRFRDTDSVYGRGIRTLVASPLFEGDTIYGIVVVFTSERKTSYTEQDMSLLVVLSAGAALRYRNIVLTEQAADQLREANRMLEEKVAERTRDLQQRNEELKRKNEEISATQNQLVMQEKMASLGTLTAGVAHEINNPNNFIAGGCSNLERELNGFEKILFSLAEDGDQEITDMFRTRFSVLHDHCGTIMQGCRRIKGIVDDLQLVTRLGETGIKDVALAETIRAGANLLQSKYPRVNFAWDLEDRMMLTCNPAELSQVFMALLDNGCRAIETRLDNACSHSMADKPSDGSFHISGKTDDLQVTLGFRDSGCGMEPEVLGKIFDPFFTTRPPGMGTGLGLYTSYNVVHKMGGELKATSTPGEGSTFFLTLPLKPE